MPAGGGGACASAAGGQPSAAGSRRGAASPRGTRGVEWRDDADSPTSPPSAGSRGWKRGAGGSGGSGDGDVGSLSLERGPAGGGSRVDAADRSSCATGASSPTPCPVATPSALLKGEVAEGGVAASWVSEAASCSTKTANDVWSQSARTAGTPSSIRAAARGSGPGGASGEADSRPAGEARLPTGRSPAVASGSQARWGRSAKGAATSRARRAQGLSVDSLIDIRGGAASSADDGGPLPDAAAATCSGAHGGKDMGWVSEKLSSRDPLEETCSQPRCMPTRRTSSTPAAAASINEPMGEGAASASSSSASPRATAASPGRRSPSQSGEEGASRSPAVAKTFGTFL